LIVTKLGLEMDQQERRHVVANHYIAALSSPNEATLTALASVLADDVRAAGMFGSGQGREAVLASTGAPPYPLLASAEWGAPEIDGDVTSVRGTFPPGLPVVSVTVTMRFAGETLVELTQELEQAKPAAPTALVIDDQVAAIIDGAFDNKTPFVVAYVDAAGVPHVSPRGTVQSWSPDQVAMWARDPAGGLLRAIETNPHVSLFYRDASTRIAYEITGRARVIDDSNDRAMVYERSPAVERNLDPRVRGVAIVVDVDSVVGGGPGGRVNLQRTAAA
jgi:predicted pyridoxine 5'-phosphate oxidase superfamily flavin-nucleotide-binding protein